MQEKTSFGIDALLFDLGGVLIDIDFDRVFAAWSKSANCSLESIRSKFSFDLPYQQHERGEIDEYQYFDSLRQSLGVDLSDREFELGWNSIWKGHIPGISKLLRAVKEKVALYVFSNSNTSHYRVWSERFADVLGHFQKIFVSSEIGLRKPEPESFQYISKAIGVDLERILFFDDTFENIAGAQKLGMQTVHVKTISDIEAGLRKIF